MNDVAKSYAMRDLSRFTGLSEHVIRIWESRYGFPESVRLDSGHRRYTKETLDHLRMVAQAVAQGVKISKAVRLNQTELAQLLNMDPVSAKQRIHEFEEILQPMLNFDDRKIKEILEKKIDDNLSVYLDDYLGPLIQDIGHAWVQKKIDVHHEHFFSRVLISFIDSQKRNEKKPKCSSLLATFEGEEHELGLEMLDWCLQENGIKTYVLGASTPLESIIQGAKDLKPQFVFLSVSEHNASQKAFDQIKSLRSHLPQKTSLVIGGSGVVGRRHLPQGIYKITSFTQLVKWINEQMVD